MIIDWKAEINQHFQSNSPKKARLTRTELDYLFGEIVLPTMREIRLALLPHIKKATASRFTYKAKLIYYDKSYGKQVFEVYVCASSGKISFPWVPDSHHYSDDISADVTLETITKDLIIQNFMEFFRSCKDRWRTFNTPTPQETD
jgi:hypothetical protein